MPNEKSTAEVSKVLDRWSDALRVKDMNVFSECYADDVRVFDLETQLTGFSKLQALWESCLPHFPNPIGVHREDVRISATDEMAVATFYSRLTGMTTDHQAVKAWMRTTVCLQNLGGKWKIIHDHFSMPVDFASEKPGYIHDDHPTD